MILPPDQLVRPTMNDEITKATSDNKRRPWREFVESKDHRTKLWRTINGIDGKSKQTAVNEAITFTGTPHTSPKRIASRRSSYPLSTNFFHQLKINTASDPDTTSALLQLTTDIKTGFNQRKPPHRTVCVAIDLTAAFDSVS